MKPEEAINQIEELMTIGDTALVYLPDFRGAFELAVKALMDNKPSRTWIAKNEYRRGWHDALIKALSETMKIHVEDEEFDMVQKETLIGLGLSMDSALGAEPYSETDESYPEPDRPHGRWSCISLLDDYVHVQCSECGQGTRLYRDSKNEFLCIRDVRDKIVACPYCGALMRKEGEAK